MDRQQQVDLILLDFSKAFDTVPHFRLLTKLRYIMVLMTPCVSGFRLGLQIVHSVYFIDGESSEPISVTSGIPQRTVLSLLMFLLYINDITTNISSPLRLFADDCLLYNAINSKEDANILATAGS